jgi:ribosome-binding factor A
MASGRIRRVEAAVRAVLGDAISKDLQDPRVGFVTVTAVNTSPDLRHARVYVSVLGSEEVREDSLEGLRSAHGFLQSRVAAELRLKHTPTLSFAYDDSVTRGMRITQLIDETAAQEAGTTTASQREATDDHEPSRSDERMEDDDDGE